MIPRVAAVVLLALLLAPFQLLLAATPARDVVPRRFMAVLTRLIRVRTVVHGERSRLPGTLFVANHLSWLDILVLGARIGVAFVAKAEVRGWGPVGWLASLAGTIYVERERRRNAGNQAAAVAARLAQGRPVIFFPEGVSGDGRIVRPFKSALFAAVEGGGTPVQPVSVAYTRIGPMPVTRRALPMIAWVGDTSLGRHALAFLTLPPVRAELLFHPPRPACDFADRKALAAWSEGQVEAGYRALMRGRA